MRFRLWILLAPLVVAAFGAAAAPAEKPLPLRVLYLGSGKGARPDHFATLLRRHFATVDVAVVAATAPAGLKDADVVVFDWAQDDGDLATAPVPLGKLEEWDRPTVLLDSAGLLAAGRWQVIGGAG